MAAAPSGPLLPPRPDHRGRAGDRDDHRGGRIRALVHADGRRHRDPGRVRAGRARIHAAAHRAGRLRAGADPARRHRCAVRQAGRRPAGRHALAEHHSRPPRRGRVGLARRHLRPRRVVRGQLPWAAARRRQARCLRRSAGRRRDVRRQRRRRLSEMQLRLQRASTSRSPASTGSWTPPSPYWFDVLPTGRSGYSGPSLDTPVADLFVVSKSGVLFGTERLRGGQFAERAAHPGVPGLPRAAGRPGCGVQRRRGYVAPDRGGPERGGRRAPRPRSSPPWTTPSTTSTTPGRSAPRP